ncbi:hypothetical protein EIN_369590 [Entamoeba invadens IP1]|uniref:Protein HIRA n=1 Tax=Entamoeba invadens IP1 TaxID=370355 RepID=A0A0A1UGG1_ENTIV|nr:hypothetical protein EIN_369590 [Entamoeba invadens IP1]ELP92637.1 hypothetical protein EIN_369590 [Entamoeba invadens IP1]|eukprot:XP_004259408.1 hypothetical protein EIN_369590 [Entamoeba invadens IP1]
MVIFKKPFWLAHDGNPIFCIDSHPSEPIVATGGGDARVKVWNVESLYKPEVDTQDEPKLQAVIQMSQNVNCLRWSPDGELLAAGTDDGIVSILYMLEDNPDGFFEKNLLFFQKYDYKHKLVGHSDSVTDVSFCSDGTKLASASLDSKVMIWDLNTGKQLIVLPNPSSVFGIAWDPLGIIIVAQCTNCAIEWDVQREAVVNTTKDQFSSQTHTNFFLRPCWSPEATQMLLVGAVQKKQPASLIHNRVTGQTAFFVGHKNEVVCSRFSPCLYKVTTEEGKKRVFNCFVVGGVDNSLSLWVSKRGQLCYLENAFKGCVQDITWLPGGLMFMACSIDGFVGFFKLTEAEVGGTVETNDYVEMKKRSIYQKLKSNDEQKVVNKEAQFTKAQENENVTGTSKEEKIGQKMETEKIVEIPLHGIVHESVNNGPQIVLSVHSENKSTQPHQTDPSRKKRIQPILVVDNPTEQQKTSTTLGNVLQPEKLVNEKSSEKMTNVQKITMEKNNESARKSISLEDKMEKPLREAKSLKDHLKSKEHLKKRLMKTNSDSAVSALRKEMSTESPLKNDNKEDRKRYVEDTDNTTKEMEKRGVLRELENNDKVKKLHLVNRVMYSFISEYDNTSKMSLIKVIKNFNQNMVWSTVIPFQVKTILVNETKVLVVCDGLLYLFWSESGILCCSPVVLTCKISKVFFDEKVIVVDIVGNVHIMDNNFVKIKSVSVMPLVEMYKKEITNVVYVNERVLVTIKELTFVVSEEQFFLIGTPEMESSTIVNEQKSALELGIFGQLKFGIQSSFDTLLNNYLSICTSSKDSKRVKALQTEVMACISLMKAKNANDPLIGKFEELSERITSIFITLPSDS